MYVRWKKRARSQRGRPTGDYTLTAVLVENVRGPDGPRQKIISYLGTIRQSGLHMPYHQRDFWQSVKAHLEPLEGSQEHAAAIVESLKRVVSIPTQEDFERAHQRHAEIFGHHV